MFFRYVLLPVIVVLALVVSATSSGAVTASVGQKLEQPSPEPVETALEEKPKQDLWRAELTTGDGVNIIGLTWDQTGPADPTELAISRMRTRSQGQAWGPWREMVTSNTEVSTGTDGDLVVGRLQVQVELDVSDADGVSEPTATVWTEAVRPADSGDALSLAADGPPFDSSRPSTQRRREEAATTSGGAGLGIATRAQWGADESLRKWSPNYIDSQAGVTIHHTAGTNSYSADQVPAILRGIYRYHAVTRDWGDVGYNLFVDKYGRAWEGRRGGPETALRTAHAFGMNYTTAGIALVGDYTSTAVPQAAFNALARVTAWKLGAHGNTVTGTFRHENPTVGWTRDLPRVHGHRDVNDTLCPGERFYTRMGEFRSLVRQFQDEATVVQRVAGPDRYATAAQIAGDAHPFGVETVYITRGDALIESLVVGAAAARTDDALLLTRENTLPQATRDQLIALAPERVVLVGDNDQISSDIQGQIGEAVDTQVTQLAPGDQYALAAELSRSWGEAGVVYMSSGVEPADALSGGAAAAGDNAPLLLSADADGIPDDTAEALVDLAPHTIYLLGGTARFPASTVQEIQSLAPGAIVTRLAGRNRYDTSAAVVADRFGDSARVLTANGSASIDAIAGTQLADTTGSAVLLTRKTCRPRAVASAMDGVGAEMAALLGGASRLSDDSGTTTC